MRLETMPRSLPSGVTVRSPRGREGAVQAPRGREGAARRHRRAIGDSEQKAPSGGVNRPDGLLPRGRVRDELPRRGSFSLTRLIV